MASSSLRVSSLCRTNPSLVNCGIPTPSPPASLHFSTAHNPFRLFSSRPNSIVGPSISFVPSAVATPNSSLLSEEDFKGFGKGSLDVSDSEYEESPEAAGEGELSLSKLRLPQRLVDTLEKRGITELFPIQRAVLMPALRGRDIIARAKTGTGKTLAFGIPIIKGLDDLEQGQVSQRQGRLPKALVLAPTRELAKQVEKEFKESAPSLSTVCIYGGVSYVSQESALSRGIDVVVGTPGRIIDLIKNKSLQLGEVRYLVLDEADQMLAVGFEEDVETIMEKLPAQRQNMLFSATMPIWVKKLARKFMENALTIDLVGDREEKLAEGIKLYAISTTSTSKRTMLSDLVTPRRYWNINLEEMLEAGVHFGHATRKWNPQMAPFISAKRNGIHITNLIKTARFLSEACDLVFDAASKGKQFLIVGTKKKAADLVAWASIKSRSHYVNKKWLGGMLTNWSTTETRLQKFRDLRMEQKTGKIDRLPKRDAAVVKRQLSRLQTYLGGIKYMTGLPDVVIIVDQLEERTAMLECITLGIPTICLVDTNCDPDLADISIPANDDAISSIRFVLNKLLFAISEGHSVMRGEV